MIRPAQPLIPVLLSALLLAACSPLGRGSDNDLPSDDDDDTGDEFTGALAIQTSMGSFEIQLFTEDAPITTENFLSYVDDGFYDGSDGLGATVFHRVIADFMVQGGGQTEDGTMKDTLPAIVNEAADSGLSNSRGTLSMARTSDPDSATSQFFVNVVDNSFLDAGTGEPGYAAFGEVTAGMDVVDAISGSATDSNDGPLTAVVIEAVERL
jgi:cyclophilin family peptidyl-prolyl cis-trans isomerase